MRPHYNPLAPMPLAFLAPDVRQGPVPAGLFTAAEYARQRAYFAARPDLAATSLVRLPGLASTLGLDDVWVKDETLRFGLPAFKGLGAGFALAQLAESGALDGVETLVCASEGNHGRAVAQAARLAGRRARVYLGAAVAEARAAAIAREGAEVVRVDGSYDDAVRTAAEEAARHGWLVISDTSWPGYEEVPRLIMLGYTRLMDEAAAAWGERPPDLMLVQGGVGGLACAVASWMAATYGAARPKVVVVEPTGAACLLTSARAGRPTPIDGPPRTIMGGLRCGEVSPGAFPALRAVADAYVAVEDDWARRAMRTLAHPAGGDPVLRVGTSGSAGIAALLALAEAPDLRDVVRALDVGPSSRVCAIATEGVTEPALWDEVTAPEPPPK
jgi:diaminopropionate ammonia-lyase